ncbi:MAG: ISL3 family transposase, partial [Verrucomicrobiaceae bacterium]|nr:ISL3 family transposase [Verrucomicrobiaceae bacterium]
KKSSNFITLIYQIDAGRRRLLWVGQRRTEACLRQGIRELGAAMQSVKYVCSDMWKPYLKVIAALLPQALNILDRFHIVAHLNGAVDAVRRGEVSRLGGSKAKGSAGAKLKNMRWNLLRAGRRVRGKARSRLNALIRAKGATARAWMLKESFEHFWSYRSLGWAMSFLDAWTSRALKSRLEPMRKVARMLRSHRELLGNYFKARKLYSSGVVEGLNLKCNLIKRRAYGLRSFEALQTALYHNLGSLPEPEITHRFY